MHQTAPPCVRESLARHALLNFDMYSPDRLSLAIIITGFWVGLTSHAGRRPKVKCPDEKNPNHCPIMETDIIECISYFLR